MSAFLLIAEEPHLGLGTVLLVMAASVVASGALWVALKLAGVIWSLRDDADLDDAEEAAVEEWMANETRRVQLRAAARGRR
jgi:hypothetical protein